MCVTIQTIYCAQKDEHLNVQAKYVIGASLCLLPSLQNIAEETEGVPQDEEKWKLL